MKFFIVDTFTDKVFKGNPAGVCLPDTDLDDIVMQSIASENNLSETAFAVKYKDHYSLRWFTPKTEIDLCGHATLGTAFVIMNVIDRGLSEINFETKSGTLAVERKDDLYTLTFPARKICKTAVTPEMERAIGESVREAYRSNNSKDLLLLLEDEQQVDHAVPNFGAVKSLAEHAVTITAKGNSADFVSRFFAPNVGVPEDPVTGSSHTALIPFWSEKLGKETMVSAQLSKRGGILYCKNCNDSVEIAGRATLYLQGEIFYQ